MQKTSLLVEILLLQFNIDIRRNFFKQILKQVYLGLSTS